MAGKKLRFGRQPPEGTKVAWGTRALLKPDNNPMFEILWEDQDAFGDEAEVQLLVDYVKEVGIPIIENWLKRKPLHKINMMKDTYQLEDGPYIVEASPQGSGKYLYIGAWINQRKIIE